MDYSQLHDAQINMMVCKALGLELSSYARIIMQDDATILLSDNKTLVDYCNNAADAWPIIQANGICIGYDGISWDASCHLHDIGQVSDWKNHPEKPLRMAMIVFLMIKDAKHA